MKTFLIILLSVVSLRTYAAPVDSDFLAQKNLLIQSADPGKVFDRTADNVKAIFLRYQPQLDSSSEIVSPLQIGGTQDRPVMKVSVRKCVVFICQVVDLDAEISLREGRGTCPRTFLLQADLRRSSNTLTDVYDRLDVVICYKNTKTGEATLDMTGTAHRSASYSGGIVQKQILDFLKLQIQPITKALAETLKANGSKAPLLN